MAQWLQVQHSASSLTSTLTVSIAAEAGSRITVGGLTAASDQDFRFTVSSDGSVLAGGEGGGKTTQGMVLGAREQRIVGASGKAVRLKIIAGASGRMRGLIYWDRAY